MVLKADVHKMCGAKWYRWRQCALALLPAVFIAMSQANFVFAASALEYRCLVSGCESATPTSSTPAWWSAGVEPRCSRPLLASEAYGDVPNRTCSLYDFTDVVEPCAGGWVYEHNNSIVAEFDLACQEWKRNLVGTVHNVGVLCSMPLMGYVSDKWGRRTALVVSSTGLVVGALKSLTSGPVQYPLYLFIELIEAAVVTGTYTTAFVYMVELIGNEKRILASAALGFAIALGELTLALIVWLVPYWRHFQLIIYCPPVLFIAYLFILDESLRWLLTNDKHQRASDLIHKMSRLDGLEEKTVRDDFENSNGEKNLTEKFSLDLLFSSSILFKRVLVCSWWWFCVALIYYGLTINSVSLLGGARELNFALSSLASVPGDLAAFGLLDRLGRKKTLCAGFLICGFACIATAFVPQEARWAQLAVYLLGKAGIATCFNAVYVYTSELMPTSARGSCVGACSMLARIGSILASLTPLLSVWWWALPTVVFGGAALTAAGLSFAAPETLRRPLPDTVAQAEEMR